MKRNMVKKAISILLVAVSCTALIGCQKASTEENNNPTAGDNIVITETGEVLTKPSEDPIPEATASPTPVPVTDVELVEPEQEQVITDEDQIEPSNSSALQIVFLGDSIFDNNRDGTGIPYLTATACGADVYNLAIGGTSASIEVGEPTGVDENWTSRGLLGVVHALKGEIPTTIFEGTRTKEILDNKKIDFAQTDYFVVEYGMNDYFRGVRQSDPDNMYNITTYGGALNAAVSALQGYAPDATIILCSPNYAQFFDGTWMIGDGNSINKGYGTLFDYKGTCEYVANSMNIPFFDAYNDLGIDGYTAEEYLDDGVHLSQAGRALYAEALAKQIMWIEETKNN